ncbi:NAD(P)/FAD-dependent oxidoreductase [Pseudooceanicola nitratireducens]|uniref:NAD(P)/FAD-dependent oxidoreductase n=1 Tax=Pseudooceanicola nitratireducens TaxID=517719 RepID=UPI003517B657
MTTYRARQLPVHRGVAAWSAILGPGAEYPALSDQRTADFVVIGGGFAGLSAARRLTQLQPGARVVLLEAGRIAEGASGRNSGFMIDLPHELTSADYAGSGNDRTMIALNRQAIAFAAEASQAYDIPPGWFDRAGKVNGAVSTEARDHNLSYAAHLDSLGETYEHLDAQAMEELTGSRHYHSGLYTPGTVLLQPAGYIRGLATGLSSQIALHERSPALGLTRIGSDWRVDTPGGSVTAPRVILATNGHLESFGFAKGRLMHVFLYASMTPNLDDAALLRLGGAPGWGITPSDPMGTTVRRIHGAQGGNRIVTRTCATLRSGMQSTARDLTRATALQREKFDRRFPQLAGMAPEYEWAGHLCLTLNGVSVMQCLDDGLFSACVQNGLGTTRGTLTGIGAAELACGVTSDITRHFTAEAAPRRLPPRPLRDIGANAVIRWKEHRIGDE